MIRARALASRNVVSPVQSSRHVVVYRQDDAPSVIASMSLQNLPHGGGRDRPWDCR